MPCLCRCLRVRGESCHTIRLWKFVNPEIQEDYFNDKVTNNLMTQKSLSFFQYWSDTELTYEFKNIQLLLIILVVYNLPFMSSRLLTLYGLQLNPVKKSYRPGVSDLFQAFTEGKQTHEWQFHLSWFFYPCAYKPAVRCSSLEQRVLSQESSQGLLKQGHQTSEAESHFCCRLRYRADTQTYQPYNKDWIKEKIYVLLRRQAQQAAKWRFCEGGGVSVVFLTHNVFEPVKLFLGVFDNIFVFSHGGLVCFVNVWLSIKFSFE